MTSTVRGYDEITYPTQREAMLAAMVSARESGGTVFICRGASVGCTHADGEDSCNDCYVIEPGDRRTVDEHLASYQKRDA